MEHSVFFLLRFGMFVVVCGLNIRHNTIIYFFLLWLLGLVGARVLGYGSLGTGLADTYHKSVSGQLCRTSYELRSAHSVHVTH
jgi:hypothetical protein